MLALLQGKGRLGQAAGVWRLGSKRREGNKAPWHRALCLSPCPQRCRVAARWRPRHSSARFSLNLLFLVDPRGRGADEATLQGAEHPRGWPSANPKSHGHGSHGDCWPPAGAAAFPLVQQAAVEVRLVWGDISCNWGWGTQMGSWRRGCAHQEPRSVGNGSE